MSIANAQSNGEKLSKASKSNPFKGTSLSKEEILNIYELMVASRVCEERQIKLYKSGDAYFWIGGPGEEAFGVPLGLLTKKGQGPEYDYLHLHYRATPTLIAMGMPMIESFRLIMNKATDPCTGGRNFSNHYCFPKMNVVPVSSPIEIQYSMALGTAHIQKKKGAGALSIVTGGDAGTAEGDFASCLVWSSRKGNELPMLITVQNNRWGISTPFEGQHGEANIADRAKAFGIRSHVINGNDPIESYELLKQEMEYIRKTGKPSFIEAHLSRLYGHSSASGANFVEHESCCLENFQKKLVDKGYLKIEAAKEMKSHYEKLAQEAANQARKEPTPSGDSIWKFTYKDDENADWRQF